ncbi:MFS general substrate transporter [Fistulina hepatica ATCC 64428]|uniref:MFS general substrate transporter n=1 Tax=Fistulina hepatica ATCC 64428 TaxID=1128425 RepID=A0A0D7ANU6_9AGAR|nr:MFS general substrate transporter [Fistulina hepatica ATCC 64428]
MPDCSADEPPRPSLSPANSSTDHSSESTSTIAVSPSRLRSASPDGGVRAYLCVLGAFLALFSTFGQLNSFGVFQVWYGAHELQYLRPSAISWIGSLQLWLFFASVSRLYDKYGPRSLLITGTLLCAVSTVGTSLCTEYYQFIICQGILFGLGVGLLFYPSLASVATHFHRYRATALGLASAGSSVGGVVYPIMYQRLFEAVGFGWGVRISCLISTVCCGIALLTVSCHEFKEKDPGPCVDCSSVRDMRFILLAGGSCFVSLGIYIPNFYISEYALTASISPAMTFYVLSVLNAGGIFGRIAPASLSDAVGRFNLIVPAALLSGVACLVFWLFAKTLVPIMLFAAVYGFLSGAFIALITPCVAQISELRVIGTRIGMLYTIVSVPSLVGEPIAGALLAHAQQHAASVAPTTTVYTSMIIYSGATLVAGSLLIFCAKLQTDRRILACI